MKADFMNISFLLDQLAASQLIFLCFPKQLPNITHAVCNTPTNGQAKFIKHGDIQNSREWKNISIQNILNMGVSWLPQLRTR